VNLGSQEFGGAVSTEVACVRRRARQVTGVDPAVHLRLRVSLRTDTQTSLRRSSSAHSIDAARCRAVAPAERYRSIDVCRPRPGCGKAAAELHVAAAYWLSIDGRDRQTDGQTDTLPLSTLPLEAASVNK